MGSKKRFFWLAVRDSAPLMIANVTWGMVTGVAMVQLGLSELWATWMNLTVYSSSSQLAGLQLMRDQIPLLMIVAITFILNLRFVIYAATLFPYFRHLSQWKRTLIGYLTVDLSYLQFLEHYPHTEDGKEDEYTQFYAGSLFINWVTWQLSTLIGIGLATWIPQVWSLDFAAILALTAVLLPMLKSKPIGYAVLVSGVVAWVAQPLPLRLGMLLAIVLGILTGMFLESFEKSK